MLEDARSAITRATTLNEKNRNRRTRLDVDLAAARVLAATGKLAESERKLHAAIADAREAHLVDRELELRLTLAEVELHSGKAAAGRARLATVRKDAGAKGFGLLERKAAGPHPSW
jgi:hypothetical protein